jgi:hypothetical protein
MRAPCRDERRFIASILVLIGTLPVLSQAAAQQSAAGGPGTAFDGGDSKLVRIARATRAPVLDGILDPDEWSGATVVEDLHQINPVEYATPTELTRVHLLYDQNTLYIGARLFDREPELINARVMRQNQPIGPDDRFFVHIDTFGNRRSGYIFGVNPNSVRFDGVFQNVTDRQFDWDGIWRAEAVIDEQGWVVEIAIPFKTLSFDPSTDAWRMNFSRNIIRRNETIAWASRNRNTDPSTMGNVAGFEGLEQGLGLDIVPSLSLRERRNFELAARDSDTEPSLDVFYKVTPSLNAALTINTDFSATEIDNRQVNLTRFDLFFPERRDFFLQDLDIFQFGSIGRTNMGNQQLDNTATTRPSRENGRPFFSRKLGLSATGEEVPIEYGGKLSGRIGRWDIGALTIRQDELGPVDETTAVVGRIAAGVLQESSVGFIATSGDPGSNLDNSVLGFDFRYLNSRLPGGRSVEGDAWLQQSDMGTAAGNDSAAGVNFRMPNNTGLRGGAGVKRIEANFNPALGYISRAGIQDYTVEFGNTWRPRGGAVQSLFSGVDAQRIEFLDDGTVQSQVISVRAIEIDTRSRDQVSTRLLATKEGLRSPFEISPGVIIAPGAYSFNEHLVNLETGNQRKVSGGLTYRNGDFYDGQRLALEASIAWRPSRYFRGSLQYEYNDVELPQGEFVTRLARLQLETAFSPTLSWVNLIQYDNISETVGFNSRVHWIPEAGREAFLVLNHNLEDIDRDNRFHSSFSELTLKFNYTLRF